MRRKKLIERAILLSLVLMSCMVLSSCKEQSTEEKGYAALFDSREVAELDMSITRENWDKMVEQPESKEYVEADLSLGGQNCTGAGLRVKGNTSLLGVPEYNSYRYSYKVEMDHYKDGLSLAGLDKLILNNIYEDPSYMAEYLAYRMNEHMEVPVPCYGYTYIKINDQDWGLYLGMEAIEDSYAARNGLDKAEIYKPEDSSVDQINPSMTRGMNDTDGGAGLAYRDDNPDSYPNLFDNAVFSPDEEDQKRLIGCLKKLDSGKDIEACVDVDECLRYFAVLTFTNNPDSYYSRTACNFYLCENEGILSILPWDLNRSFAGYTMDSYSAIVNAPIDDPWDATMGLMTGKIKSEIDRPLFQKLMEKKEYKEKYYQYLGELSEWVLEGDFKKEMKAMRKKITPYIEKDQTRFYTVDSFNKAADSLSDYIMKRAESVERQIKGEISSTSEGRQ